MLFDVRKFGLAVERARIAQDVSQDELAVRSGLTQSLVSRVCRGVTEPRVGQAIALEVALGLAPASLILAHVSVDGVKLLETVEQAILADRRLTPKRQDTVLEVYRTALVASEAEQRS